MRSWLRLLRLWSALRLLSPSTVPTAASIATPSPVSVTATSVASPFPFPATATATLSIPSTVTAVTRVHKHMRLPI